MSRFEPCCTSAPHASAAAHNCGQYGDLAALWSGTAAPPWSPVQLKQYKNLTATVNSLLMHELGFNVTPPNIAASAPWFGCLNETCQELVL